MTHSEIYKRAAEILASGEKAWCQGAMMLDANGAKTWNEREAVACSADGALLVASENLADQRSAIHWFSKALGHNIYYANDRPGATVKSVVRELRAAARWIDDPASMALDAKPIGKRKAVRGTDETAHYRCLG